ncbi:MAG: restriction endonuclease [Thiothrix lacustris]|uniref:Restriction endonuclease n=1 Tax=Thiothrix lacustris TaxID=525917 RepID=A0A1Y1QWA6_9GAMM|nr:MAG: restriction endonuclease [Thiothrix lacustris]
MKLTIETLCSEAARFAAAESQHPEPSLFGVTDGKAVGTYLEHKFRVFLRGLGYQFEEGNSANGIDFPCLAVDMKVTSIRQPQSSCPFRSARQKVYGLGYSLIIFVYGKTDDEVTHTANLNIADAIFVDAEHTADFQMSKGLRDILENDGNRDDLVAFLSEKNLPVDEIGLDSLVTEILQNKPKQGYLTISNALQWRLQYSRVIEKAGNVEGVRAVYRGQTV